MNEIDFGGKSPLLVRAKYLGERLDLKPLEKAHRIATAPLTIAAGNHGCAVLFRYGVVVFFNVDSVEEIAFLESLTPYIDGPFSDPETDEATLAVAQDCPEGIADESLLIHDTRAEKIQLIADVLAKSTMLSYYESSIAFTFDQVEPLAAQLRGEARPKPALVRNRSLMRLVGHILTIHHKMIGRAEVRDKPELVWDFPELERLYIRLAEEYEIRERYHALDRKLQLVTQTTETLIELLRHRSTLRVEWYIVILILVEIVLMLAHNGS